MARGTKRRTPAPPSGEASGPESGDEGLEAGMLEAPPALIEARGGEDYVRVHRQDDLTKEWIFHGRLDPQEATEEHLDGLFGGGVYRLIHYTRNPIGKFVIVATRKLRVPGRYRPPQELPGLASTVTPAPAAGSPAVPAGPVGPGSNATEVLNAGMVATVMDLLRASREQMTPRPDPMMAVLLELMAKQNEQQTTLLTALLSRPEGGGGQSDMLSMIRDVREMVTPRPQDNPANPAVMMREFLRAMREFREASTEMKGDGESDPMASSIDKLVGLLARGVPAPAPAPAPQRVAPPVAPPPPDLRPIWQQALARYRSTLIGWARAGLDPEWAAETVDNLAPGGALPVPGPSLEEVLAADPALLPYRDWMGTFLSALYGEEAEEPAEEVSGEEDADDTARTA